MAIVPATNNNLEMGKEYLEPNEAATIAEMIAVTKQQVAELYANKKVLRQAHPKSQGCVKAEFIIEPDLPNELKVGVFGEGKTFPAWIRFSNGKTLIGHDKVKDVRGISIKLMNVPGEKLMELQKHYTSQDFILTTGSTFFSKSLASFNKLLKAVIKGKMTMLLYFLSHPVTALRTGKILSACKHLLASTYYSGTPYRFGKEDAAVKYQLRPSDKNELEYTDPTDFDFLKKNLIATLAKHTINFDFGIQFQKDAVEMPVEDATVEWTSPFIKLATLTIPAQVFDTPAQNEFGENLTYNIWHSLPQHRPLGSINRCRKLVYEALYQFRREQNHLTSTEPEAAIDFLKTLNGQ